MRYPASEKLEIIRIVEQSHLPARRTLEQSELSPRELAVRFTDEQRYFVSEATVLDDYSRCKSAPKWDPARTVPTH